jgi:hypothetical protein
MATRYRLTSSSTAPAVSPAVQSYTHTGTTRRKLLTSDASTLTTQDVAPDVSDHVVAGDTLHVQFVSDPMPAGVTFTSGDVIKFCVQAAQDDPANNLKVQVFCSVVDSAGTTVQRVVRSKVTAATTLSGVAESRYLSTTQDGATYTTAANDRLVVEFSLTGTPTAGPAVQGHNGQVRWGGSGGSDLAESDGQIGTTANPWIEFVPNTTGSASSATGSLPLFISGFAAASGQVPLYTLGNDVASGGLTLFVGGKDAGSGNIPLFTLGPLPGSGGTPLFVDGYDVASGQTPLFVGGHATASGSFPLYVSGVPGSYSGAMPLFTWNFATASGALTLYETASDAASGALRLYVQAGDVPAASGWFPLVSFGAGQSGNTAGLDLYTFSDASGQVRERGMNLFLLGDSTGRQTRNVNLWVGGLNRGASSLLDLYLHNAQSGVSLGAPLYASGDGTTPDALGQNRSLNLVLARNPANAVSLFAKGPGEPTSGSASLFTFGAMPATAGANLAVPKVVGGQTQTARLYTHGF